jgi:hypothetical protein
MDKLAAFVGFAILIPCSPIPFTVPRVLIILADVLGHPMHFVATV